MQLLPPRRVLAASLLAMIPGAAAAIGHYDSRNGDECRAQVIANFKAMAAQMAAAGNTHGITSNWNRWLLPQLEACEQMDQRVRTQRMAKASERLDAAIATLRADGVIRHEEKQWLERERDAIAAYPDSPYRDAILALFAEFMRYASPPSATRDRCPEIQAAAKSARREHDAAVDALLRHEPEWRLNDEVRVAALAEMRWQQFLAKRARCTP